MPTDPFRKPQFGEFNPPSARTLGHVLTAAQAYQQRTKLGGQLNAPGPGEWTDLFPSATKCLIQAAADLPAYAVQQYGPAVIDPASDTASVGSRPAFIGQTPSGSTGDLPFVITTEPIAAGTVGHAVASGLAVVQLQVNDPSDPRAIPVPGQTGYLASAGDTTGIPIVAKGGPADAGRVWALVLVGDPRAPAAPPPPPPPPLPPVVQPVSCPQSGESPGPDPCQLYWLCDGTLASFVINQDIVAGGVYYLRYLDPTNLQEIIDTCGLDGLGVLGIKIQGPCDTKTGPACLCPDVDTFPPDLHVGLSNGTGQFANLSGLSATATIAIQNGRAGYTFAASGDGVSIGGALGVCCSSDPKGWYFTGTITSTRPGPPPYLCGCTVAFNGCPGAADPAQTISQAITAGPTCAPSETLHLKTPCGSVDLSFGPVSPPPPPPPPDYYCCSLTGVAVDGGLCLPADQLPTAPGCIPFSGGLGPTIRIENGNTGQFCEYTYEVLGGPYPTPDCEGNC